MENMNTGGPEGWVLFQTDDPDPECGGDRKKATLEEWLAEMDKGSDVEDCPHRAEPEIAGDIYVYRIVTANDVVCCRIRDVAMTYLSPTKAEPNRWVAVDPAASFGGVEFAYMGSILRNFRRAYKEAHGADLVLSDWEMAVVYGDASCGSSAAEHDEWLLDDLHEAADGPGDGIPGGDA